MASSIIFSLTFILFIISIYNAQSAPPSLIFPVSKDAATNQYLTRFGLGTPLVTRTLVIDLGGRHLWLSCDKGYNSTTYTTGKCGSPVCLNAKRDPNNRIICLGCPAGPARPGCNNNTCSLLPENSIIAVAGNSELTMDTISLKSLAAQSKAIPSFIFGCAFDFNNGFAAGATGMAGFGREPISMSLQLFSTLGGSLRKKFAICLPSSSTETKSNGIILVGDNSNYSFYPNYNETKVINVKDQFSYTKLLTNPVSSGRAGSLEAKPSSDYFIGVKSILVNRKPVKVNTKLLSFNRTGFGGTKFSTVDPYTLLETSIYRAVTRAFDREIRAMGVTKAKSVAPFTKCYSTKMLPFTMMGPGVPDIQFVLENQNVYWEMSGSNLMVEIGKDVVCLGIVDGGIDPRTFSPPKTPIIIGGHQLENNVVEFDLASSRVGFASLLWIESQCTNFRF